jgi:hypothetical protein
MTIEMDGRHGAQCRPERRRPAARTKFAPIIVTALTLSISGLPFVGGRPARAAEITFQCINPVSGTTWNLKIDDERRTANALPAKFTTTRTMWRDIVRGGSYELDRKSGLLTFHNASSTGGYTIYYRCHAN